MARETIKVRLLPASGSREGLTVPEGVRKRLGIEKNRTLWVRCGGVKRRCAIEFAPGKSQILVHPAVADELCLPLPKTLHARFDPESGTLALGPVVAVFAVKRRKAGPRSRRLFGARNLDMRQLMRHGRSLGMLAYVVTPEDVDPEKEWIEGYVLSGRRWSRGRFPLPDVVYDRIQARSWEKRPKAKAAKEFFRSHPDVRYFNEGFFDKWAIHQKMEGHEALDRYLPPTRPLGDADSLRSFMRNHPAVFLKPTEGSQGKGVIRVRRRKGHYEWRIGGRRGTTQSFDALYRIVCRVQRRRRYIMQPDLRLATFGGAPFDIRLLMQKDGSGRWKRTKWYARVAARGRLTSNLSRGGTGMGIGGVLGARFGKRRRKVMARVRSAARAIVLALDDVIDGPLGEVGLDLGVDRRGRVWLIEVNAKPYRKVHTAGPKRRVWLSFRRPMAFARYLAGF